MTVDMNRVCLLALLSGALAVMSAGAARAEDNTLALNSNQSSLGEREASNAAMAHLSVDLTKGAGGAAPRRSPQEAQIFQLGLNQQALLPNNKLGPVFSHYDLSLIPSVGVHLGQTDASIQQISLIRAAAPTSQEARDDPGQIQPKEAPPKDKADIAQIDSYEDRCAPDSEGRIVEDEEFCQRQSERAQRVKTVNRAPAYYVGAAQGGDNVDAGLVADELHRAGDPRSGAAQNIAGAQSQPDGGALPPETEGIIEEAGVPAVIIENPDG